MAFATKWTQLQIIILSEICQPQEHNITCFLLFVEYREYKDYVHVLLVVSYKYCFIESYHVNNNALKLHL